MGKSAKQRKKEGEKNNTAIVRVSHWLVSSTTLKLNSILCNSFLRIMQSVFCFFFFFQLYSSAGNFLSLWRILHYLSVMYKCSAQINNSIVNNIINIWFLFLGYHCKHGNRNSDTIYILSGNPSFYCAN